MRHDEQRRSSVEGLNKRFGSFHAVDDVRFEAEDGKITALLGPSGSGKSTVAADDRRPGDARQRPHHAGRRGADDATVQERRVGFVFQHYALFRHMTVRENVAFGLSVRKEPKDETRGKRVDELLELVQLAPFADRYPDQLSGGQRQRVALARALAPRPKVLLLDEPFGALDARVRQELRRWLDDLHRELGVTSLLVTHDQEEALELANEIVVMHQGRVEQIGTPDGGLQPPRHAVRRRVHRRGERDHGLRERRAPRLRRPPAPGGTPPRAKGSAAHAYIRPLDIRIVEPAERERTLVRRRSSSG